MVTTNPAPPPAPPDHTQGPEAGYTYTNTFVPLKFTNARSYGWAYPRNAPYNYRDVPLAARNDPWRVAYEWYRMSDMLPGGYQGFAPSNPPFGSNAAGQLLSTLHVRGTDGQAARILRGFIRRSEYNVADKVSQSRLYFMFNPTVIARDYVSYLDQGALDPFNTVFQSNNLVAPPSMLNFTFELFFDRQDEARDPEHPGVLVDMEYFDMVVRNVIPDPAQQPIPDNGVMMVNPRDITVVFSPEITVQGRPLNASVVYEKFTHRMVPTRMRIQLTMRVIYWGPQREMTTYTVEEDRAAAAVSFAATTEADYKITFGDLKTTATGSKIREIIDTQLGYANVNSTAANSSALDYAVKKWNENGTQYSLEKRMDLWNYADCSSLVWGAFQGVGQAQALGWPKDSAPAVFDMWQGFKTSTSVQKIWGFDGDNDINAGADKMQAGDLLLRTGGSRGHDHIAFVAENTKAHIKVFHAMSPSKGVNYSTYNKPVKFDYDCGVRPLTMGGQSTAAQANDRTRL